MITTIVKVTLLQMRRLEAGETVGSHTYDPEHCFYVVDDGLLLPEDSGKYVLRTDDNGESYYYDTLDLTWDDIGGKPSTFPPSAHNHSATEIISGVFADARIPSLAASKITSGIFTVDRIPNIPLSKVTGVGTIGTTAASTTPIVTTVSSSSTDAQIPTARAVYNALSLAPGIATVTSSGSGQFVNSIAYDASTHKLSYGLVGGSSNPLTSSIYVGHGDLTFINTVGRGGFRSTSPTATTAGYPHNGQFNWSNFGGVTNSWGFQITALDIPNDRYNQLRVWQNGLVYNTYKNSTGATTDIFSISPAGAISATGHLYLTGAVTNSSTSSTSQIVFGTANNNHVAISSNTDAVIINPSTSSTTGQIILGVGSNPYIKVNNVNVSLDGHTHSQYLTSQSNDFGKIKVGSTTTTADAIQDTITFAAGGDASASIDNKTVTFTYTHPTTTAVPAGLYKVGNDAKGHVVLGDSFSLGTAAPKNYTTTVTQNSSDLVTSGAVWTAIDNLPEPMVFKGTLGTGGTITSLPTAAATNEGYTYKVITAGTYASQAAKVGDVFVSNGSAWVLIPAGDTDTDTWRAIKVNGTQLLGSAISTGAVNFKNGSNITITGNGSDITITGPTAITQLTGWSTIGTTAASTTPIVTTVDSNSTNSQIPTALAVYEALALAPGISTVTTTGSGNGVTAVGYDGDSHTLTVTKGSTFSLNGHTHAAGDITSGTFDAARIPSLVASKITSGTFDAARIPDLSGTYAIKSHNHDSVYAKYTTTSAITPSAATGNGFWYVNSSTASLSGADSNPLKQYHTSAPDFRILTTAYSTEWLQQIATDFRSNNIYFRRKEANAWKDWVRIALSGEAQPASDVYAWAKASSKPAYTAAEVGALPNTTSFLKSISKSGNTYTVTNSADGTVTWTIPTVPTNVSAFTNDAGYLTTVAWGDVTGKPTTFTPSAHTHTQANLTSWLGLGTLNNSPSWGTVKSANGYTVRWGMDQAGGGGIVIGEKGGQTSIQVDGDIYVNEGTSRLARASEIPTTMAWGSITGKPTEFPPSAHNHSITDITDVSSIGTTAASTVAITTSIAANSQIPTAAAVKTYVDNHSVNATVELISGDKYKLVL